MNEIFRWDIINYFIEENNYKNYLEIGYEYGVLFDKIRCNNKIAIDPNPLKNIEQIQSPQMSILFDERDNIICKMPSDIYFSYLNMRISEPKLFDIIFIDGLHECDQVLSDIKNSIKYLNERGMILLHDCNPPFEIHTTIGDKMGNWTGDVYKAIIKFRKDLNYWNFSLFTIDADWGIAVITKYDQCKQSKTFSSVWNETLIDWQVFDKNRKELLNLTTFDTILEGF